MKYKNNNINLWTKNSSRRTGQPKWIKFSRVHRKLELRRLFIFKPFLDSLGFIQQFAFIENRRIVTKVREITILPQLSKFQLLKWGGFIRRVHHFFVKHHFSVINHFSVKPSQMILPLSASLKSTGFILCFGMFNFLYIAYIFLFADSGHQNHVTDLIWKENWFEGSSTGPWFLKLTHYDSGHTKWCS